MSEPSMFEFAGAGGLRIAAYRWDPTGEPRAMVQLAHGMGEHARRYQRLAEALTAAGYVVYANDHRGHGATLAAGAEPGALGPGGWSALVGDIGRLGDVARTDHPGLGLALVAHSMGSFAAQQYLLTASDRLDAVALSGTAALDLLEPALDLDAPLDLSAFNAAFEPARTEFDWLSRDPAQVDAYVADPLCGFGLDTVGGKEMFVGARDLADPDRLGAVRPDLPVYIAVGESDPVNAGLALVRPLVDRLREAGLVDLTLRTYPGARHEILNETNRAEVVDDLVGWLDRVLG